MKTDHICYDIIYKIFFYINDYETLCNMTILSKTFYNHYIRQYNSSYKHKYTILYNDLFFFLSLLPDTDYRHINYHVDFYKIVISNDKSVLLTDIQDLYRLYRVFFIKYFTIYRFDYRLYKQCERLTSVLLMQGPEFLSNIVTVKFNQNKILFTPISLNRSVVLNKITIMCLDNNSSSLELLSQVQKIDNLYKYFI